LSRFPTHHQKASLLLFETEEGFTEEDGLWSRDERESKSHVARRAREVLDKIFDQDNEATCAFLSITFITVS
jgi:hypothetical protein